MLRSLVQYLAQMWRKANKPAPSRKPRRRSRLQVEELERRWVPALISGYVFHDIDGNGAFNAGQGDVGIQGNTLQLQDPNGNVLSTTQTGVDGSYSFSSNQSVNTNPQTQTQSYQFADATTGTTRSNNTAIKQFDSSKGTLQSVTIISNTDLASDIKVENEDQSGAPVNAHVGGTIDLTVNGKTLSTTMTGPSLAFNATSFDGVEDFAGTSGHDFGLQTATGSSSVLLNTPADLAAFLGTGNVNLTEIANSTSAASGSGNLVAKVASQAGSNVTVIYSYVPSNALPAGHYKIVEVNTPPGYQAGPWTPTNGQQLTTSTGQEEIDVTLTDNNSQSNNNNFSFYKLTSVSGNVYNDANGNGIQDPGEPAINGQTTPVTVTLTGTAGDGSSVTIPPKQVGVDGSYTFTGLKPGTYDVAVTTPAGYFAGTPNHTELPPATSLGTEYSQITLNSGVPGTNFNFGFYQAGSLSGHVFLDTNGITTGLSDIQVSLVLNATGKTVATTTTDSNGFYQFLNLPAGDYTIVKAPPTSPLIDEKKVTGSLGVDPGSSTTAPADEFFVSLGTQPTGRNVGTGYDFYETAALPPSPPPLINVTPPHSKFWLCYD